MGRLEALGGAISFGIGIGIGRNRYRNRNRYRGRRPLVSRFEARAHLELTLEPVLCEADSVDPEQEFDSDCDSDPDADPDSDSDAGKNRRNHANPRGRRPRFFRLVGCPDLLVSVQPSRYIGDGCFPGACPRIYSHSIHVATRRCKRVLKYAPSGKKALNCSPERLRKREKPTFSCSEVGVVEGEYERSRPEVRGHAQVTRIVLAGILGIGLIVDLVASSAAAQTVQPVTGVKARSYGALGANARGRRMELRLRPETRKLTGFRVTCRKLRSHVPRSQDDQRVKRNLRREEEARVAARRREQIRVRDERIQTEREFHRKKKKRGF